MQVDLYHYNEGTFATIVATPSHSNEDKLVPSNEISHISNFKVWPLIDVETNEDMTRKENMKEKY